MSFTNIENYISKIKIINGNENLILQKIKKFIIEYIDESGYIDTSRKELTRDFLELLEFLILKKNLIKVKPLLKNCNKYLEVFNKKKIFYKDYFENLGINFSTLITTNILYDEISKLIFLIYIYGTTVSSFEQYFYDELKDNKMFVQENQVKLLDTVVSSENLLETYNFNANSYKILILGHLNYKIYNDKKIIIENVLFAYARIVLELVNETNYQEEEIISLFKNFLYQYSAPSTPMFYNSYKKNNMLSSCFIISIDDTVESIGYNLDKIFNIQKYNSGIGVILNNIRSKGRPVMDGITESNSVLNFVDILSLMSNHYDNKIRNRSSNINLNLSVYHPEIFDFLKIKVNNFKKSNFHFNKIFQTLIIPDEFIYRYLNGIKEWYLIPADQHINNKYLHDVHGEEFSILYNKMICDDKIVKFKVQTEELFSQIINTMIKTGGPFLFFEDIINYTSNQKNLGKIKGTNLCTEILEYSDDRNTACCNLSSINLSVLYLEDELGKKIFDFEKFKEVIKTVVKYLNLSIDKSFYSHETCTYSNLSHKPIGIGIQGLANLFNILGLNYLKGKELYKKIMEYLYYYSLYYSHEFAKNKKFNTCSKESNNICKEFKFHFELFKEYQIQKINKLKKLKLYKLIKHIDLDVCEPKYIPLENWENLKNNIIKNGLCNSLLIALMPTSISSFIYNNNESFEPFQENIEKKTLSVYDCINYNTNLVQDLINNECFDEKNVLKELILNNGNINKLNINNKIKLDLLKKYQTLYDIDLIDYLKCTNVADPFVDQGISFNLSIKNNNNIEIGKAIIMSWILGKKTTYYYRTNTIIEPLSFNKKLYTQTNLNCTFNSNEICSSCVL